MSWTVGGRYQLTDLLGSGENGEVWRARDRGTDREVAVKLFHSSLAADARLADRFLRARGALTGLWHPGIARLLDVIVEEGTLALVTDLASGVDLAHRLAQAGPLPPIAAAQIAATAAEAMAAAHRVGVVHGDLKPSNVLVARGPKVQLTDFSVALFVRAGRLRSESSEYAAPDIIDGAVPGPASDVFALGCLIRKMTTGTTSAPEDEYQGELQEVAQECLRPDPATRPEAQEVHDRLQSWLANGAGEADQRRALPSTSVPAKAPSRESPRRPAWWVWVGAALAIGLATWGTVAVLSGGADPEGLQPFDPGSPAVQGIGTPSQPAGATAKTQEGGVSFVGHWFALLSYAVRTGDTVALDKATNTACAECRPALEAIRAGHADDAKLVGGTYVVRRVSTSNLWTPERAVYDVTVDRSQRATVNAAGLTVATLPALSFVNCVVVLEWTDERWRVLEIPTTGCVN